VLNANELLEIANEEINKLISGEVFFVWDLFKRYEWKLIPKAESFLLGTLFLNYIKSNVIGVVLIEKISLGNRNIII